MPHRFLAAWAVGGFCLVAAAGGAGPIDFHTLKPPADFVPKETVAQRQSRVAATSRSRLGSRVVKRRSPHARLLLGRDEPVGQHRGCGIEFDSKDVSRRSGFACYGRRTGRCRASILGPNSGGDPLKTLPYGFNPILIGAHRERNRREAIFRVGGRMRGRSRCDRSGRFVVSPVRQRGT